MDIGDPRDGFPASPPGPAPSGSVSKMALDGCGLGAAVDRSGRRVLIRSAWNTEGSNLHVGDAMGSMFVGARSTE